MSVSPFIPWPAGETLVLASRSPRRAELLRTAGIPFEVRPAGDVEGEHAARLAALGTEPDRYAEELARLKARAVCELVPGRLVLGADTIVVLDGEVLEKPRDEAEAREMLGRLSGRRHVVISAIALCDGRARSWQGHERTEVEFLDLESAAIARYVDTGEPMDKAGAYGIQGRGAVLVDHVEGSYTNVMGLPLRKVLGCIDELQGAPP